MKRNPRIELSKSRPRGGPTRRPASEASCPSWDLLFFCDDDDDDDDDKAFKVTFEHPRFLYSEKKHIKTSPACTTLMRFSLASTTRKITKNMSSTQLVIRPYQDHQMVLIRPVSYPIRYNLVLKARHQSCSQLSTSLLICLSIRSGLLYYSLLKGGRKIERITRYAMGYRTTCSP